MINIVGDYWSCSGFSNHVRGLSRALKSINSEVTVETLMPADWTKRGIDDVDFSLLSSPARQDAWQVMIMNPLTCQYKLIDRNKGVLPFMITESRAPKQWGGIAQHDKIKAVLAASEHNKRMLVEGGIPEQKIVIVPHGVDTSVFHTAVKPLFVKPKDKCVFLINKGWNPFKGIHDRGNVIGMIRAYHEEFKPEESVELIVKLNPAYLPQGMSIDAELQKYLPKERAVTKLITDALPNKAIASLYCSADVLVGVSRSEAFNLPILEGMAVGLPVITNASYSGSTDYVPHNNWFVNGVLGPITGLSFDELPQYEGGQWMNPDIPELRQAMRQAFEEWKAGTLAQRGLMNAETAKAWSWQSSAEKL